MVSELVVEPQFAPPLRTCRHVRGAPQRACYPPVRFARLSRRRTTRFWSRKSRSRCRRVRFVIGQQWTIVNSTAQTSSDLSFCCFLRTRKGWRVRAREDKICSARPCRAARIANACDKRETRVVCMRVTYVIALPLSRDEWVYHGACGRSPARTRLGRIDDAASRVGAASVEQLARDCIVRLRQRRCHHEDLCNFGSGDKFLEHRHYLGFFLQQVRKLDSKWSGLDWSFFIIIVNCDSRSMFDLLLSIINQQLIYIDIKSRYLQDLS